MPSVHPVSTLTYQVLGLAKQRIIPPQATNLTDQ